MFAQRVGRRGAASCWRRRRGWAASRARRRCGRRAPVAADPASRTAGRRRRGVATTAPFGARAPTASGSSVSGGQRPNGFNCSMFGGVCNFETRRGSLLVFRVSINSNFLLELCQSERRWFCYRRVQRGETSPRGPLL